MTERKTCTKCKRELPLSSFAKDKNRKDGLAPWCRDCRKAQYYSSHERYLEYARKYRAKNPHIAREYYNKNKEEILKRTAESKIKLKLKVFHKISDSLECASCLIDDTRVLCVDHIHNNGKEERKKLGTQGVYRRILKISTALARKEYQILCRNCNWLKGRTRRETK